MKLKKITAFICTLAISFTVFILPASADISGSVDSDISVSDNTNLPSFFIPFENFVPRQSFDTLVEIYKNDFANHFGFNVDDYYWITFVSRDDYRDYIWFATVSKTVADENKPCYLEISEYGSGYRIKLNGYLSSIGNFELASKGHWTYFTNSALCDGSYITWIFNSVFSSTMYTSLYSSDVPIYYGDYCINKDYSLKNCTPYNVSYSPNLSLNMKRTATLTAPGSANDGQEITYDSIKATYTLNPDYVNYYFLTQISAGDCGGTLQELYKQHPKWTFLDILQYCKDTETNISASLDLVKCNFDFCGLTFISTQGAAEPFADICQNSIYTYLTKQKYSMIDQKVGAVDGATSTATSAYGYYPIFKYTCPYTTLGSDLDGAIARLNTLLTKKVYYSFDIPLENCNFQHFKSDAYTLYSIISRGSSVDGFHYPTTIDADNTITNDEDDTIPAFSGTISDFYSQNEFMIKEVDDSYSLNYFWETHDFSFDEYPDYVALTDENGDTISTDGDPTQKANDPVIPDKYISTGIDGTETERTPEQQIQHDNEVHVNNQVADVDFGLDTIESIFDGTSQLYKFLTASIGLLPGAFLTVLLSFFVIMLGIVVVKWVLK